MNTHESYVSLETAKMLKEAGFDWECIRYYQNDDNTLYGPLVEQYKLVETNFNVAPVYMDQYSAPTLAVAQRWLRDVKGWEAQVAYGFDEDGHKTYVTECGNPKGDLENYIVHFSTYEETLEACIKKCLTMTMNKDESK